jgi:hypothetical protein
MVKNIILSTFICVVFFCICSFASINRMDDKIKWTLDPEYSANLTITSTNYKAITNSEVYDAVNILRIYKNIDCKATILTLPEILSKKIIFESGDKNIIKKIISSAQIEQLNIKNCYQNKSCEKFYIVAFNRKEKKAGYFILSQCSVTGELIGIIQPFQKGDSSTIYFNKILLKVLKKEIKEWQ